MGRGSVFDTWLNAESETWEERLELEVPPEPPVPELASYLKGSPLMRICDSDG